MKFPRWQADTQKNDYKPQRGDRLTAPSFRAEIRKIREGFGGIFFAKHEKIVTKQNTGIQVVIKL